MGLQVVGQVGPQVLADGVGTQPMRQGRAGELVVQELHGRFYEQNLRGALYAGGMTLTAINNATFTSATLGATCTPILGVWNPGNSTIDVVVLQAQLQVVLTALQSTGGGPFVWAASVGNLAITTGNNPLNRRSLLAPGGAQAKDMSGVALTGLTNNLVVRGSSGVGGGNVYNIASTGTAVGFLTQLAPSVENVDGAWVVPPGGVLALLATTTPVAHSVASALIWEEVAR